MQDTTHTPFCDNLAGPTTFVIDQYTDNAQFDNNAALTLTYTGAHNNSYVVSLPAYNTGSATVTPAPGLWWNPTELARAMLASGGTRPNLARAMPST